MLNAAKTDIGLLIECLKYQMKSPDSQKQALLTIVSICQQNDQAVDFLKEIGGVTFIYNLSSSSHYSEVKETALFTLGSLAEFNESCKQMLCREEMFCHLAECMTQSVSHTQKRVAVYMLSALVSSNRRGQSLAKNSGCIDILLNLFRGSFPVSGGPNELLQLWTSVSSALCACVNNPQNEENQRACLCVFPLVKEWLLQISISRAELAQPICSFIGMTVANNSNAQEYFTSIGGLFTLTDVLASVVPQCKDNAAACRLATAITKTLSACIADNEVLAPALSQLQLVPYLLLLLSSPNLSPRDQLAVVLTLGHCTDACVEHQLQLLQGGGLPLMISLLTEDNDKEVRKAATFVLQSSKKILEYLGGSLLGQNEECDLQHHWQSANKILQRIQHLEKRQQEGQFLKNSPDRCTQPVLLRPVECSVEMWEDSVVRKVKGQSLGYEEESDRENIMRIHISPLQPPPQLVTSQRRHEQEPVQLVRRQILKDFDTLLNQSPRREVQQQQMRKNEMERVAESVFELQMGIEENKREFKYMEEGNRGKETVRMKEHNNTDKHKHTEESKATHFIPPAEGNRDMPSPDIFRHPAPMKRRKQRQTHSEDEISVCSELLDREIQRITLTVASKPNNLRCAGCMCVMDEVDSRTVAGVLSQSACLCEFHQALQKADGRFKRRLQRERALQEGRDASTRDCQATDTCSLESTSKHPNSVKVKGRETDTHKTNCCAVRFINLTPLKRPCETEGPNTAKKNLSSLHSVPHNDGKQNSTTKQRKRQNYSADELAFLRKGVRRFGHSWNTILWAFPFQHGRTNVDLAKKYRTLKQGLAQAPDLVTVDSGEQSAH